MASPESIVTEVRGQFERLLAETLDVATQERTMDSMERHLFRRVLDLGRALLELFVAQRAQATRQPAVVTPADVCLAYHSERRRTYGSIFGPVPVARPYFYEQGHGGYAPLDARLSLPAGKWSDLVREWTEELAVGRAYHRAVGVLDRFVGLGLSSREVAAVIAADAQVVPAFYAQQPPPPVQTEGPLLVLQADGKGVPILRPAVAAKARLGKGEKLGGKKEAILTGLYTIAPAVRTPQAVVASLFKQPSAAPPVPPASRTGPQHKRLYATLTGKTAALAEVAGQVARRDGPPITQRIALTDGSLALQQRVLAQFPQFTLVLDCIHMVEYLWKAANALLGETHVQRTAWVRTRALQMLSGQGAAVSAEFVQLAQAPKRSRRQAKVLQQVAAYLERNLPYMHYDQYLAQGWPIATGVIEGACRHLVKDRCELSGMRWTIAGAEALLAVRCVHENGDWEAFHAFRRQQRHQQLYHTPFPAPAMPVELRLATLSEEHPLARAA
ncbi:MAG TPA: ISKra4 family transposase [Chloroflexota bacterium]|nr:ISKra4 family transposase [Chloroflexota bacterium]